MFTKAIVKRPCKNMVKGISEADLGLPEYEKALFQHQKYVEALQQCGLEITELPADENFPDSVFVEDTAVLVKECAVMCNSGALERNAETHEMRKTLEQFYKNIEEVKSPGTIDGGDVMQAGKHFFVGLSNRTNENGARQLISILEKYGYTGETVELDTVLHLKTGIVYLEENNMLASGEFIGKNNFKNYNILTVDSGESYSANCIRVNDYVIIPEGFEKTKETVTKAGYKIIECDMSEFQKLDGGLSCLSLRF